LVGATLTVFYTQRLFDFEFLFSEKGLVPYSLAVTMVPEMLKPPFILYPSSESLLYGMHVVFVLLLIALTLGVGGRGLAFFCWIFHLVFVQRNITVVYGADFVATCWLLYMWMLKTDSYLTLSQVIKKRDF